jgi:hypothetical protein
MVLKGIGSISKKSEEAQSNSSKDKIKYVTLKDKESAMLRFLTDSDEIISAEFHTYKEMTPQGEYTRTKYCPDTRECQKCAEGNPTKEMLFLWAYLYYILHPAQNPALDNDPTAAKWERVTIGGKAAYKEIINDVRVFRTGVGKDNKYRGALVGFAQDYGTFLDRDYRYTRTGEKLNTTYDIIPQNPKPVDDKIKALISSLPDLSKVVTGEIYAFNQSAREEVAPAAAPAARKPEVKKPVAPIVDADAEEPAEEIENIF